MYENDDKAGIERNVKTGPGVAAIVAVVIGVLLFLVPQLSFQKIEESLSGLAKQDTKNIQSDKTFFNATKQVRHNLKVQTEKKEALIKKKAQEREKAAHASKRLPLLMVAVQSDNLYLVKRLIENGINPTIQDVDGNEALAYVTDRTSPETIDYLLRQGLDINHRNKFQNTPPAHFHTE